MFAAGGNIVQTGYKSKKSVLRCFSEEYSATRNRKRWYHRSRGGSRWGEGASGSKDEGGECREKVSLVEPAGMQYMGS
jgi:hypothetical protein